MKYVNSLILQSVSVAVLAACGGGGGGDSGTASTTPATTASFNALCSDGSTRVSASSQAAAQALCPTGANTLVTSVPVPGYAVGTPERLAFDYLNAERGSAFGQLKEVPEISLAAKNHADYLLLNYAYGHGEAAGGLGYTGIFAGERMAYTKYSPLYTFSANEAVIVNFGSNDKLAFGIEGVRTLLNAPYHLDALMSGERDVGISIRSAVDAGSIHGASIVTQINLASKSTDGKPLDFSVYTPLNFNQQMLGSDEVAVYPCGKTGVGRALYGEEPNPVPGRNLSANPLGRTVLVAARRGNVLLITSSTMTNVSSGASVLMNTTHAPLSVGGSSDYAVSDAPLAANTAYQTTVNGTNNGKPFSRTCGFTTGS